MKLLMVYSSSFGYKTNIKNLDNIPENEKEEKLENVLVGFIHVEQEDEENQSKVETKLVKNLKWAAKKNNTNKILLHSFAHLSESKASPQFTEQLFNNAENRLQNSDFEVSQTPFGYFLDLDLQAPGISQARIFKNI